MKFRTKRDHVDPDKIIADQDKIREKLAERQERVNVVSAFLLARRNQNGFGEDFEFTLRPKGQQ